MRLEDWIGALPDEHVADATFVRLPANVPPWTSVGIDLEAGDVVSLFAEGRVVLSEEDGLWNGPSFHLWSRVGGRGPLHNGTRDTTTFESPHAGPLELCVYSGEWRTRDGELGTPVEGYALLTGGLDVLVVRWKRDAEAGLAAIARGGVDSPLFVAESRRLADPTPVPDGWHYLWFLGPADIYRPCDAAGRPGIRAHTSDDVGILQRPVDVPLTPATTLGWRWRVDELPSQDAEDTLPTHDYLSIAVEFENGQDLTYYWSSTIPKETHYRCPLPNWDQRETHLVVRSGEEGLGSWHEEARTVQPDYERAIGAAPEKIVAVWLIAVSVFQKNSGAAEFADIWIDGPNGRTQIL
jgi:hypothetical protein